MDKQLRNIPWLGIGLGFLAVLLYVDFMLPAIESKAQTIAQIQTHCIGTNLSVTGFIDGQVFIGYSVLLFNSGDRDETLDIKLTLAAKDSTILNQMQLYDYCMKQRTSEQLNGRLIMPEASWDLVKNTKVTITKANRSS